MSARVNHHRHEIPARVRANLDRRQSAAAGPHRGCRVARPTDRRAAIARSLRGE